MLLIKNNTNYIIKNQSENLNLEGTITFDGREMTITAQVFLFNDQHIGSCSYTYRRGGTCSKVIGNCNHQYISIIETLLEETLNFIIGEFKL